MKISKIFLFLFGIAGVVSCHKDNFDYPKGTVGISKIIYFPAININGDKIAAVVQGAGYTDPGATATLNGAATTFTASTTISASTAPGVYTITYTAKNEQGYTATDFRVVDVIPTAIATNANAIANDFSGTYLRGATGVTSTWTKIGPGTYSVENAGGAASGAGLIVIAQNPSGSTILIPSQSSPYYGGTVSSSNETYSTVVPETYSWKFLAPNYGTGLRTFVKQ